MTSSNMALRLLHRRRGKKGKAIRVVAFETNRERRRRQRSRSSDNRRLSSCRCSERCSLRTPIYIHGSRKLKGTKGWRQADHEIELL
ncbi:hypothetical protein Bca4012_096719 [Brassica carinata]|uniref:Uncharacterized protein n=1 Tax=Brassica carinata TaxID=52824 RepID=A0A8X7Q266_BRACI|nr:hypothetical protein Bca52824_079043 [Brassica carinata]